MFEEKYYLKVTQTYNFSYFNCCLISTKSTVLTNFHILIVASRPTVTAHPIPIIHTQGQHYAQ